MSAILLSGCSAVSETPSKFSETVAVIATAESETVTTTAANTTTETPTETTTVPEKLFYDFPEEFYTELDALAEKYPHFEKYEVSLMYCDLETSFTFMLNEDEHYYPASVTKAPYMLYIYNLALSGEADLDEKILYTKSWARSGTGILKNKAFGQEFTIEELIGFSLEYSDNAAYAMLRDRFPESGYIEFMRSIGVTHEDDLRATNQQQICCETSLIISREIYNFIEDGNRYSENLRYHMTHSSNPMIHAADGAEIVRKYGWYLGYFHDMAVVYGERPYLLTIMTDTGEYEAGSREFELFTDLSMLISKYSTQLVESDGENIVATEIPRTEVN